MSHLSDRNQESSPARVSETAEVIARLIPSLPMAVVDDLGRLIQRRLTTLNPHSVRHARLGLLIDIVSVGTGEVPKTRDYEKERETRKAHGEEWPTSSTLSDAFGGWTNAVRAAMVTWREGSSARTAFSHLHKIDVQTAYSHEEATGALLKCAEALGVWPTEFEYDDWRRASRELALASGTPYPRYPSLTVWKRMYGNWPAFEEAARKEMEDGTAPGDGSTPTEGDAEGGNSR